MDSLYNQARNEGGIVDMFLDDIKGKPKKKKMTSNINPKSRTILIKRIERDIQTLKSMEPR